MSNSSSGKSFVHGDDAWALIKAEADLAVQQLMAGLLTAVLTESSRSDQAPSFPIDLAYVASAAQRFFSRRALLQAILDGQDLRWFPEDW